MAQLESDPQTSLEPSHPAEMTLAWLFKFLGALCQGEGTCLRDHVLSKGRTRLMWLSSAKRWPGLAEVTRPSPLP